MSKPVPERAEGITFSLSVTNNGVTRHFFKKGVRDLEYLLDNGPDFLRGASVVDKVVGKASAGMMAYGDVRKVHALTLSRLAIPVLENAGIEYSYDTLVERILIPEGDKRCPLEKIVEHATSPAEIVSLLRDHFAQMKAARR